MKNKRLGESRLLGLETGNADLPAKEKDKGSLGRLMCENVSAGAGDGSGVKAHAAFAEDLSSVSSTGIRNLTAACNFSCVRSNVIFWPPLAPACT